MVEFNMLLVSGSRSINDKDYIWSCISKTYKKYKFDTLVEGGAEGVDHLTMLYAISNKINHFTIYPQWYKHGNRAGIIRNVDMIEIANQGIAIWDGKSTGTKHCIKELKKAGILLEVFMYEKKEVKKKN